MLEAKPFDFKAVGSSELQEEGQSGSRINDGRMVALLDLRIEVLRNEILELSRTGWASVDDLSVNVRDIGDVQNSEVRDDAMADEN